MSRIMAILTAAAALAVSAASADWPQFQGPSRNGQSDEKGLARTWPAEGPPVLWRIELGAGFAGPSIRDGKVYVLDRVNNEKDVLRCLDLETGKEEWTFAYDAPGRLSHDGSRSTPTVTDKHVFIVGPFGHFHCVDKATHQALWRKHLLKDFAADLAKWGVAQSPVLHKDAVIVAPQGQKAGLAAFDQATGKLLWASEPIGPMAYGSPLITTLGGVDQVIMISADRTVGVRAGTGEVLWAYKDWYCKFPITSPTPVGDGRIFITGGYTAGSVMIRVSSEGGKFSVKELYRTQEMSSQTHQPLLLNGLLYANSNSNEWQHGMMCMDLDGNVKWKTGNSPNFERGNLIFADGLIYNLDGKTGHLRLIDPSPDGYKQLAEAPFLGGKEIWAPMALSNGRLIIRDQGQMKCLDVKAK